ncbi:DMT family transporter [Rhizobium sp. CG5]|uniref:DMT family transporter n=1 Tax=Rhizobium sp. CG5 TaxID=2726076 RepID=UPI0020332936|nr:DMT family transporter [Rhizobium sp. CG5]MCM2477525.1 DMT family transporter [Rhizobium sp. CG5]
MTRQIQGFIGVAAAQMLLGTLGVCVLESGADPLSVTFYRCVIGGLVLALYGAFRGNLSAVLRLPPRVLGLALASGLLMVGNWVLFFTAMQHIGIAVATIVFHVQPFMVVVIGALVFRERLHAVTFGWIALALIGLALATESTKGQTAIDAPWLLGICCALGGAFLYSVVTIIAKGLTGITGPQLAFVQCLCGIVLLVLVVPVGPLEVSSVQWAWFAVIGVVHTGGVYMLLYNALPKLSTPLAAVLLFLYPATAIIADAIVYGHRLGPAQYAGVGCILIASLGVTLKWGVRRSLSVSASRVRGER